MKIKIENDNRKIDVSIGEIPETSKFYDVRKAPFTIYGLYDPLNESEFKRMPDSVAMTVNNGVKHHARHTSGGRVRFSTDSQYVTIYARMDHIDKMPHFPLTGSAGFDIYIDTPETGDSKFYKSFIPPFDIETGYTCTHYFSNRKMRYITIYFPTYSGVTDLFIGLDKDAVVGKGMEYRSEYPTVYYGSSITQGGCVSRPGNTYQAIVSRRLGIDFINLGFSGSALGEDEIIRYLAGLNMSSFVSAYDHNSDVEGLKKTHYKLYRNIRDTHPDIPYIIISRADFDFEYHDSIARREVIYETYRRALSEEDKNVYFIDGAGIFRGRYEDSCTVDSAHFNDLGFMLTADAVEAELRRATQSKPF